MAQSFCNQSAVTMRLGARFASGKLICSGAAPQVGQMASVFWAEFGFHREIMSQTNGQECSILDSCQKRYLIGHHRAAVGCCHRITRAHSGVRGSNRGTISHTMPSYWPDKPHKRAHRTPLNKIVYRFYCRFALGNTFGFVVVGVNVKSFAYKKITVPPTSPRIHSKSGRWRPNLVFRRSEDVQENRYPLNACLPARMD